MMKKGGKVGVLRFMTAAFFAGQRFSAMSGVGNLLIEDPEVIGFLRNVGKVNHWWEAEGDTQGFGMIWVPSTVLDSVRKELTLLRPSLRSLMGKHGACTPPTI